MSALLKLFALLVWVQCADKFLSCTPLPETTSSKLTPENLIQWIVSAIGQPALKIFGSIVTEENNVGRGMYLEGQCIIWKKNAIIHFTINGMPTAAVPSLPSYASLLMVKGRTLVLCHILKKQLDVFHDHKWHNLGSGSQGWCPVPIYD